MLDQRACRAWVLQPGQGLGGRQTHADPRQAAHDQNRDLYLRSLGCTILRFSNRDLLQNSDAVLARIVEVASSLIPRVAPSESCEA